MIASDDESHDHNHKPGKSRLTGEAGAKLPQNRLTYVDQHDDSILEVGEFHHHVPEFYANVQGLVTLISQRQRGHIKVPEENLRLSS